MQEKLNIKEALERNNYVVHNIKGISMLPLLIENEDVVVIEKIKEKPKKLDMVLFTRNNDENTYILHRIIDIQKDYYLICGDNQDTLEKVYLKQIIGKVIAYYRKGHYVSIEDDEYKNYVNNLELDVNKRIHLNGINKPTKDLISLLRATIHNKTIDQETFDFNAIYNLAKKYSVAPFIFKKIDSTKCSEQTYRMFLNDYNSCIQRTLLFDNQNKIIYNEFNSNNIKYIPLKGSLINKLYPEYGTRLFTDADIFVDSKKKAESIMKKLDFTLKIDKKFLQVYYKKPIFNYEIHQKPIDDEYSYATYFNNMFKIAKQTNKCEYILSNEDFYAFFLAHFQMHYDASGAGIRFYLDLYYILNKMQFDQNKLNNILNNTGLFDFNKTVVEQTDKLFNSDDFDAVAINNAFPGSTFGSKKTRMEKAIKTDGKLVYLKKRLFVSAKDYGSNNKYLNKYPFLVFFYRIYTLFRDKRFNKIISEFKYVIKH